MKVIINKNKLMLISQFRNNHVMFKPKTGDPFSPDISKVDINLSELNNRGSINAPPTFLTNKEKSRKTTKATTKSL